MIRASFDRFGRALVAAAALTVAVTATPAKSAIETDPLALYGTMRKAFEQGEAHHWPFVDEQLYLSTILDAGRAYSLFRPTDPQYAELANLTVTVATQLHYDPLTSNDAADWYVREAAKWTKANADSSQAAAAQDLLTRLDAEERNRSRAASDAVADAAADVEAFPHDGDALAQSIVADVRAYNLTHDRQYRSTLLHDMADPEVPLVRVPDPEFGQMLTIATDALIGESFTDEDRANARVIQARRQRTPDLQVIARVHAIPHDLRLTRTAPADEYFGSLKMSPIGIRNEVNRINRYLDAGWGNRMTNEALNVVNSVDDWQHQYPRDYTLPANLLNTYRMLERIDSPEAHSAAVHVKDILLVQYASSSQARQLAPS